MVSDNLVRWRLVILCIGLAACSSLATLTYGRWIPFGFFSMMTICFIVSIYLLYKKIGNNVAFVLDAVENNDFAFRYASNSRNAPDRNVNAYLNRLIDILERLTDDIREKDRYYELILNAVDSGILVMDDTGAVLQCNHAARRLLRCEVLTRVSQLARVHPSLPEMICADPLPSSINLSLPSGPMSLSIVRSRMTLHGKSVSVMAISDISRSLESKEMESWESLTRVLTHEIMNSLTPVISICESLITDSSATSADYHRGLSTISSTGKGLKRFVESYRTFANIPVPRPAPFYVKPFLEMMRDICLHQFPSTNAKVTLKCSPADLMLYADEHLISLVVTNILKNAMQATAECPMPEIAIAASLQSDESIKIDISNNGPVITLEAASQIFLPFFTTKPEGTGVGLSIARRIMAASGGSLSLRTLPRTTFTLTFP